jgi:hypothetical protein
MKTLIILVLQILLGLALFSCNQPTAKQGEASTEMPTAADSSTVKNVEVLTAKFIEFELGDAPHFIFEDQSGKTWDFAGNEDPHYPFAEELPENLANETNQGWTSDKSLQGKWFDIKYEYRTQPEYPDGPMASVPIILEAISKE